MTPTELAGLLRAEADGELPPEKRAALEAHLASNPEDHRRIEFERQLRGACRRSLCDVQTPPELRGWVEESLAAGPPASAERSQRMATSGSGGKKAFYVLAAMLVVGIVGAYAWIKGGGLNQTKEVTPADYAVRVASHIRKEHGRVVKDTEHKSAKFTCSDFAQIPDRFAEWLGRRAEVRDAAPAGFRFVGAGECSVPYDGSSAHLRFETDGSQGTAGVPVSLFVKQNLKVPFIIPDGQTYTIDSKTPGETVYVWAKGGAIYYLIAGDESACAKMREIQAAPTTIAAFTSISP